MSYEYLECVCGNRHYTDSYLEELSEDNNKVLVEENGEPFYKLQHTMIYDISYYKYDKDYRTGNMYVCSACGTLKIDLDNDWRI